MAISPARCTTGGYGQSESSPVITDSTLEANKIGTVGRPIRDVEVRIADDGGMPIVHLPSARVPVKRRREESRPRI
jgi:acyl-CoA synthetase (AMP-forming)/AMP-acid ligase II